MIFQHTHQLVMAGRKTQTRRVIRSEKSPCRVGASIAVQPGRGKKSLGRVMVTDVRREKLGQMTEEDAGAEGYASREEFTATWQRMHGQFDPETEVWVITFRLAPDS